MSGWPAPKRRTFSVMRAAKGARAISGVLAGRGVRRPADDGDVGAEGFEELDERLGDATGAEDRDPPVKEGGPRRPGPLGGEDPVGDAAQAGQAEGEGVLGDRLGVDALSAG